MAVRTIGNNRRQARQASAVCCLPVGSDYLLTIDHSHCDGSQIRPVKTASTFRVTKQVAQFVGARPLIFNTFLDHRIDFDHVTVFLFLRATHLRPLLFQSVPMCKAPRICPILFVHPTPSCDPMIKCTEFLPQTSPMCAWNTLCMYGYSSMLYTNPSSTLPICQTQGHS